MIDRTIRALRAEIPRINPDNIPVLVVDDYNGSRVEVGSRDRPQVLEIPVIWNDAEFVLFLYKIRDVIEDCKPRKPKPHWQTGPVPNRSENCRRKWKEGTTQFTIKCDVDTLCFIPKPIWK